MVERSHVNIPQLPRENTETVKGRNKYAELQEWGENQGSLVCDASEVVVYEAMDLIISHDIAH